MDQTSKIKVWARERKRDVFKEDFFFFFFSFEHAEMDCGRERRLKGKEEKCVFKVYISKEKCEIEQAEASMGSYGVSGN